MTRLRLVLAVPKLRQLKVCFLIKKKPLTQWDYLEIVEESKKRIDAAEEEYKKMYSIRDSMQELSGAISRRFNFFSYCIFIISLLFFLLSNAKRDRPSTEAWCTIVNLYLSVELSEHL